MSLAGVDFGSKLAGTTVIASCQHAPSLFRSEKGRDADAFLLSELLRLGVRTVFLDAPLSLPGVYTGLAGHDDFLFRTGDRALGAMSPMFLGGLTARAMRLKKQLDDAGVQVYETYPAAQAKRLELPTLGYKRERAHLPAVLEALLPHLSPFPFEPSAVQSWHDVDALLALLGGLRREKGEAVFWGSEEEGGVWV